VTTSVQDRIRHARYSLASIVTLQALLYAGAALFGALSLAALIRWKLLPRPELSVALQYIALLAGMITGVMWVWRGRFAWSRGRVALWIEERVPQLRYALVTLADPDCATTSVRDSLDREVARADLAGVVRRATTRSMLLAVLAFAAMACTFAAIPPEYRSAKTQSLLYPAAGGGGNPAAADQNRLASIRATVTPPAYTKMPVQQLTDPLTISGVVGTQVVVIGRGSSEDLTARLGEQTLTVASEEGEWTLRFALPKAAATLKLVDRQYSRTVVIDPRPDLAPIVKLTLPGQDMTLREPVGSVKLEARITDDIGIARAHFEYIVSSGEGEGHITARMGELGARVFSGTKSGDLSLTVPFSTFGLKEGDILSVSAVAFDANDVTGPGKGRSETRSIRIPRRNEPDEVAITPAPLAFDKTAMSLRMIIIAAEKLHQQRTTLPREKFVEKATTLGRQGEALRQKLQTNIDEQSEGREFPVDPLLNEAMSHMWDGVRALNVAEPGEALPPLRSAYDILRKLSNAQKYYIRGRVAPAVVDIDRVRMTGTEEVNATGRQPRAAADSIREKLEEQYAQAVALLHSDSPRALETFMSMRVTALQDAVVAAQPLQEVIEAIHAGQDATLPLLKARQAIEGASRHADALPVWSNSW
jgi:hypothetical protein